jgi:hypothetical protein
MNTTTTIFQTTASSNNLFKYNYYYYISTTKTGDYIWFGPPVSRNLTLDNDFLELKSYPKHRSSKMPGMSQAMTKSEFARALITVEKFIRYNFQFNFLPCTFVYPDHMKGIIEYIGSIHCKDDDTTNQYMIIKPSVGSQGKDIIIAHVDDVVQILSDISSKKNSTNEFKINSNTKPAVAQKLLKYQHILENTMDKKVSRWDESFKHEYVVQKYIDNPYLINNFKFDIRLYVVSYIPVHIGFTNTGILLYICI